MKRDRTAVTVKTDDFLDHVTTEKFQADPAGVVLAADRGVQTVVTHANSQGSTVIGLNGVRFLPDPNPDPLDELIIFLGQDRH